RLYHQNLQVSTASGSERGFRNKLIDGTTLATARGTDSSAQAEKNFVRLYRFFPPFLHKPPREQKTRRWHYESHGGQLDQQTLPHSLLRAGAAAGRARTDGFGHTTRRRASHRRAQQFQPATLE